MEKLSNQKKLKPWMGVVLFVVSLVLLLTIGSYVQMNLGLAGVIITEICLLLIALSFCKIRDVKVSEVLPVKKISVTDVFGVLAMSFGAYFLSLGLNIISLILMPGQVVISDELNGFLGDTSNVALLFLTTAIFAPICEEVFMRGSFLSCFRGFKKDWHICLIVGITFGLFHIYPFRYAAMTSLGVLLTYLMVKKNNILLPILMHFINNGIAFLQSVRAQQIGASTSIESLMAFNDKKMLIASSLINIAIAVIFIAVGVLFVNKDAKKIRTFVVAGSTSALLFVVGASLSAISVNADMHGGMPSNMLLNWNYEYTVREDFYDCINLAECKIGLNEDQTCRFNITASAENTDITFNLYNADNEIVYTNTSNALISISEDLNLAPGDYKLEFNADADSIVGKNFKYKVIVERS